MVGTSNLAFASATSGKIEDEKLEDKDEFKDNLEVLKIYTNKGVDSTQLVKDIFSKFYKCTKAENKKLKKNILNFSLNFGIKINDVKDFFKGKIKIAKDKKNVIVLKKDPIFVPLQDTEEKILESYKSLLNKQCIILELDYNGVVSKLYNTTVDNDRKELSEKVKSYDTKELFDSVLNNKAVKNSPHIKIIKLLNEKEIEYGLYESNTLGINLDGYIVIDVDRNDRNMLSTTPIQYIDASIKSNISSISISGTGYKLSANDVIIAQKEINGKKKLLIAKAEDVSKGKIGNTIIDKEFYKSSLENFFVKVNNLGKSKNHYISLIQIFIDEKYDCGQYQLDEATINKFRTPFVEGRDSNYKGLEWICLRNDDISNGSINTDGFKKNINYSVGKPNSVTVNGMDKDCYLQENDIVVAIESNKNLLLIAKGSDISAATVNGQTIDDSFYETTPAK